MNIPTSVAWGCRSNWTPVQEGLEVRTKKSPDREHTRETLVDRIPEVHSDPWHEGFLWVTTKDRREEMNFALIQLIYLQNTSKTCI